MKGFGLVAMAVIGTVALVTACGGGASPTATRAAPSPVPPTATQPLPTATPVSTPQASPAATPTRAPAPPTSTPQPTATAAPAATVASSIKRGGVLRTNMSSDPNPWDVPGGQTSDTYGPFAASISTLVQNIGTPVPKLTSDLAESWDVSADGKVVTFKLVKGVQWHDGAPLTAADIKVQLDRIFLGVGGYISFLRGFFTAAERVEAPDPSTVRVLLKRPSNAFLGSLSHPQFLIYAPQVPSEELRKGKVIGSGAFMWEKWEPGVRITLRANPNFFRRDPQGNRLPYLDGIEYNIIKDLAAALAAYRTGRLDMWDPIEFTGLVGFVDQLKSAIPGLRDGLQPPYLFDTILVKNAPPFNDIRVRQALQYGLDRKLFVEAGIKKLGVGSGFALPGPDLGYKFGLTSAEEKTFPGIDPAKRTEDLAKARDLMRQAGYGPDKPLKAVMPLASVGNQVEKATVAAAALRDAGFQIELNPEENAVHNRRLVIGGDFQLLYRNFGLTIDDPAQTIGTFWTTDAPRNYAGWSDADVDRLYAEQESTTDQARRPALIQDILKRVYTQAYNVIVAWSQPPWVLKPEVKGWPVDGGFKNINRHETTWLDK